MSRSVSAADVARLAGVSGQTVSRVANGSERVDPGTRARVEAAMQQLGYRPHRAARALRTGRTRTIGVLVRTLASVGNARMLEALVSAGAAHEHAVLVVTLADDTPEAAKAALAGLADHGVDGAIALNEATPSVQAAGTASFPLVAVDASPEAGLIALESDHAGGAAAAVRHLLDAGAATVHHLAGPAGSFAADERERGWRSALSHTAGQDVAGRADEATPPDPIRGDWTAASGFTAGRTLAADPSVTAVFAANDQMALGLLRALREADRADVAVVGFDDVVDAAHYQPPLTTVAQDFDALGATAVDLLLARVAGTEVPARTVIPTRLVLRGSA
ncbi:LacI family DNA-binding transcriptional regulator [Microbacterium stercoris]|uniref:LacI family DNA-binding transcriptional regulator n=1 Tax=Microbacterium stercoris TaxID=2820289 RepID=A0A939QHS6_9MICO|nr:LacI family DNA-binding transcriptional regulator [Microbacterium stercoris]MBO3661917.1 LacI family DNA-binding transcriptional regulator [Microbacterium stercoris]